MRPEGCCFALRRVFAVPLVLTTVLASSGAASATTTNPIALYGNEIRFDVLRDGKKVGDHLVRFAHDRGSLLVHATFDLSIKFLGFSVYSFNYVSRSAWRDGRMVALEAQTDEDGDARSVRARSHGKGLEIKGPAGTFAVPGTVLPTDHWNVAVLDSDHVLNTLTGKLNRVRIVQVGTGLVETAGGGRQARHFRYTGDLETEVWYDSRGRWVKLRFKAEDGSTIDYRCRRCGDGD